MNLRLQVNLIVGVLTLGFVAIVIGLQTRSMRDSVREEVVAANRVAAQLLERTAWRYSTQGTPAMLQFLQGVGRIRSNDITLIDTRGEVLYRSPPSPYKAGRNAPAWFAGWVSPPLAMQAIQFPDGRLEVRANASRAALDEWEHFLTLVGSAVALLVAVNVLVFWLVGRTVRPFAVITSALESLQGGRFDVTLPPLRGTEAAAIGLAFNRMVGVLQKNIETERRAARAERELSDNRELTRWLEHHVEQERRLIARELHDELGQSVTAMRSMALSIAQRVAPLDAQAEQAARLIAAESSNLYDAMHGMIPRLAPLVLDSFGLADAVRDLAERTRRSHPAVQLELGVALAGVAVSGDAALTLYRAVQEGVTNALRHGQGTNIHISLQAQASSVVLAVQDNGMGLAADWRLRPGHHGLRWLGERAEALGGEWRVEPAAGGGTVLHVRVPAALADVEPNAEAATADLPRPGATR